MCSYVTNGQGIDNNYSNQCYGRYEIEKKKNVYINTFT